jgi:hypothetical protein
MRLRFLADADLDARIIRGLRRREQQPDFQRAEDPGIIGLADPEVLRRAGETGRVLVTHDRRKMPAHFREFIADHASPGVIIVAQDLAVGAAIEELLLIWLVLNPEDLRNRLLWIPL